VHSLSDKQAQFRANFYGWCAATSAPLADILDVFEDRLLFRHTPEWEALLDSTCSKRIEGIRSHNPAEADEPTAVDGWCEDNIKGAAQFIKHEILDGPYKGKAIEIDFDRWNPTRGLGPALLHGLEVLWNKISKRKTSPYKTRNQLNARFASLGIEVEKV